MDGFKNALLTIAIALLAMTLAVPVLAQTYGGGMQQGQAQQAGLRESGKDLMATIEGMKGISMFAAAVKATGYDKMLSQQEGPLMVFAPADSAITRETGVSDVSKLLSDESAARGIVEGSIVSSVAEPQQGTDTATMTSIGGGTITAKKTSGGIMINGVKALDVVRATNGIVIVTDGIVGVR
jgi:uncharacterized surface protein with fasciclin (FAS1) repeats